MQAFLAPQHSILHQSTRSLRQTCPRRVPHISQRTYMRRTLDKQGCEYITLEAFLKLQGVCDTGGQAKMLIREGDVLVNGTVEIRRGRKLRGGDVVGVEGEGMAVEFTEGRFQSFNPTPSHLRPTTSSPYDPEMSPQYSVLLPTYNERENLPYIVYLLEEAFKRADVSHEVIIIDDNSPDNTQETALALREHFGEHIILAARKGKEGLGSAYKHGLTLVQGEYVFILDADLSHHPKFIPAFIKMQRETGCDVVTGTRYVKDGGVYGWDLRRKAVSRVANYLAAVLLRPGVSDLTGSFRLYRRDVFERIMKEMKSAGYVFQMEIAVRAKRMGLDVREVPITFVDRLFGESKMGVDEIAQYLKQLWDLVWV